jgi:Skp family chaperone for outer membrane proteins
MDATKAVAASKNYGIVLDYRVVFTGGVDISDEIIQYLNAATK